MRLIIDIPEEDVNGISNLSSEQLSVLPIEVAETLMRIKNGTPISENENNMEEKVRSHYGRETVLL